MDPREQSATPPGPLAGVRVLEVGSVIMAPYAGKILRDMGAEVVKAEPPGGDIGRRIGLLGPGGTSVLSLNLNAGKKSIVVDAATQQGAEEMRRLIGWADIVLTNVLPHRRRRFGLSWEQVEAVNPRAVLVTGQGFASDSAHADAPAYDDVVQAASGLADSYRLRDGAPRYSPYVVADKVCGMSMAQAALAGLHSRGATGTGCWADVPMVDTMAAFTLVEHMGGQTLTPPEGEVGWSRVLAPEHRPHRALDGWVCVMPYSDANWAQFCELLERPDLLTHPHLVDNRARSADPATYEAVLADYAAGRTCAQIEAECGERGIPAHRVTRIDAVREDPYLSSRPLLEHAVHAEEGEYVHVGSPVVFSGMDRPGPADCGREDADRAEVLRMLDTGGEEAGRTVGSSSHEC